MNKSVMKCCICNNENIGQFITINNKKYHLCCIEQLQQENQKYKEVIDKAIKFIDNYMYENYCYVGSEDRLKDILKEVSDEKNN